MARSLTIISVGPPRSAAAARSTITAAATSAASKEIQEAQSDQHPPPVVGKPAHDDLRWDDGPSIAFEGTMRRKRAMLYSGICLAPDRVEDTIAIRRRYPCDIGRVRCRATLPFGQIAFMKIHASDFRVRPGERVGLAACATGIRPLYKSKAQYHSLLTDHIEESSSCTSPPRSNGGVSSSGSTIQTGTGSSASRMSRSGGSGTTT